MPSKESGDSLFRGDQPELPNLSERADFCTCQVSRSDLTSPDASAGILATLGKRSFLSLWLFRDTPGFVGPLKVFADASAKWVFLERFIMTLLALFGTGFGPLTFEVDSFNGLKPFDDTAPLASSCSSVAFRVSQCSAEVAAWVCILCKVAAP